MAWYVLDEALNKPSIGPEWVDDIIVGDRAIGEHILQKVKQAGAPLRGVSLGFDCYIGVNYDEFLKTLSQRLTAVGLKVKMIDMSCALKSSRAIESMVRHCLTVDSYFGNVFDGHLKDFFSEKKLARLAKEISRGQRPGRDWDMLIVYGPGALLTPLRRCYNLKFYADITRERVFRDIGEIMPLGAERGSLSERLKEKRLAYVDFQVIALHKKAVLKGIDFFIDANEDKRWRLFGRAFYEYVLDEVGSSPFRLRPVYIPGVWGGQRLKKLRGLPSSMVNCSFSLEVIPHHQSVRTKVGKEELEVPFYNLVWAAADKILGKEDAKRFNQRVPFNVNYDDTVQGGNLAIQVHPNGKYLRKHFNELMRRDESYYVVETYPGAGTYHGLQNHADVDEFRRLSRRAEKKHMAVDHDRFANKWTSKKGDLFLIPAGTLHGSGANQLVLEIDSDPSRTGAEYTFHIYDYLRPDLNGNLRAIHLKHSFNVLKTHRRRSWVGKNLKQPPRLVKQGNGWAVYLLGERFDMFYKIYRLEFDRSIIQDTGGKKLNILTLVTGERVIVRSWKEPERSYEINYTETVCIPACVGKYEIINKGRGRCWMTRVMIK